MDVRIVGWGLIGAAWILLATERLGWIPIMGIWGWVPSIVAVIGLTVAIVDFLIGQKKYGRS